jgi:hypothetical protein
MQHMASARESNFRFRDLIFLFSQLQKRELWIRILKFQYAEVFNELVYNTEIGVIDWNFYVSFGGPARFILVAENAKNHVIY